MQDEKVTQIDLKLKGDIFDNLDELRLDQDFEDAIGVKKHITTIPIRKPNRQDFIRVHPDETFRLQTIILEIKEDRENYLISRELRYELPEEVVPKMLYTTINRQGVLSLWPVRLPDKTDRLDSWNRSAHKAAELAMSRWVRVASSRALGAYEIFTPIGELSDPEWPDISFPEMLRIGFGDYMINSSDHPVLRRLRGEM